MIESFLNSLKPLFVPNEVQKQAIEHTDGPILLLASPGSGKTTTIIARIGYLISCHNVMPKRILAVSFSRASARDMEQRYKKLFPQLNIVQFSTIHSLAFRITTHWLRNIGRKFEVIEGSQEEGSESNLSKSMILRQLYEREYHTKMKDDSLEELLTYISYVKNKKIPKNEWQSISCKVSKAAQLLEQYEYFKNSGEVMLLDFDDMLTIAEQALREDKQLRELFKSQYDYIVTDESQDTSLIQHHIIAYLAEDHQNLCVVADDDQSIYSWRGAEPSYLLQFRKHYPKAKLLFMQQNYRSSETIVNTANQFIAKNKERYVKHMFTTNELDKPITFSHFATVNEEVDHIVKHLQKSHDLSEVAILYRNHYSSLLLVNELDRHHIPFYMRDYDNRFFKHWVVEDIKNFMRLSYVEHRLDIFEKIAMKMNLYLSQTQLTSCKRAYQGESVFELLLAKVELKDYQYELIKRAQQLTASLRTLSPQEAIACIRHELGYEKELIAMSERLGFRKEYLLSILNSLEGIAKELQTLEQFVAKLNHLEQIQIKASRKSKVSAVTLSTLHSSKGLEFDEVYMIDLVQQVIPSRQDQESSALMEEARRLFYVGMTRARHTLHLMTVNRWQNERAIPSKFMTEVEEMSRKKNISLPNYNLQSKDMNLLIDRTKLVVGANISHKHLGQGIIIEIIDLTKLKVNFVTKGEKILQIDYCVTNGLIEVVEQHQMVE